MKAIQVSQFGGPEVLAFAELPDPVPTDSQVVIKVLGASVNFADIKSRRGGYHAAKQPPFTPGLDVAGKVIEVGSKVKEIRPGDHVIGFPASGSYAEKAVAAEDLTFVIPKELDMSVAAAAPLVAGTTTHMLNYVARIRKGECVLVHGAAGGVGTTAIQVAKALGAGAVIGSTASPWKEEHVKRIGADAVIDYRSESYAEQVNTLTGGEGVDIILNPIGGPTIDQDLECLAPFGRLMLYGKLHPEPSTTPPAVLHPTNRSIIGFSFGHYRRLRPQAIESTMTLVIDMLETRKIEMVIDSVFDLQKAAEAHRYIEERRAVGKVLLIPG